MDQTQVISLLVFGAIALAMGAMVWASMKRERRLQAGYAALAARRALTFRFSPGRGRTAPKLEFLDPTTHLVVTITRAVRKSNNSGSSETLGSSVADLPEPRLQGGIAVYAPKLPGVAGAASKLMGMFDNSLSRRMLSKFLGDDIGPHIGTLTDFPAPEGVDLMIMANSDPALFFDVRPIARAIESAPRGRTQHSATMVMLTETGLKLRVGRDLNEPADIEALIDTALTLQAALR